MAFDDGGRSSRPFEPLVVGAAPTPTSRVDEFDDGLVPYLGDPDASRSLGKAVQVAAGALVLFHLVRCGLWAYFAVLSNDAVSRGQVAAPAQLTSLGQLIDSTTLLFWPSLIGAGVVDAFWRRKRRPKDVLQTYGEAYVEAPITRVVPAWLRAVSIILVGSAVAIGFSTAPTRLKPSDVTGYATSRTFASLLWALSWGCLALWVFASEHHLARRIEKAMDPALATFTVPYVEPEAENPTIGQPSGAGWILRTAGLVIVGLFALLAVIGSISELPSSKNRVVALIWLAGGIAVLALVGWAFVRRWRQRGATSPH